MKAISEMTIDELFINGGEGLFREGEENIAKSSFWSCNYAQNQLKGRFRAGEEKMKLSNIDWSVYIEFLKNKGIKI